MIAWHKDKGLTVSRLKRYDHTFVLQSENASYESINVQQQTEMEDRSQSALVDWKSAVKSEGHEVELDRYARQKVITKGALRRKTLTVVSVLPAK